MKNNHLAKLGFFPLSFFIFLSSCDNIVTPTQYLPITGGAMSGDITMSGYKILDLKNVPNVSSDPTVANDGQSLTWNATSGVWEWAVPDIVVTNVSVGSGPLVITNPATTPEISIIKATASADGYLTSTDWTTFNNKLSTSTVFSGDISGTYNSLTLADTIGTSGTASKVTYDAKGRITATGSLNSGDITTALGYTPLANSLTAANIFVGSAGGVATAVSVSGDATLSNLGVLTLANTIGSSGTASKVTYDAKGRITATGSLNSGDITTALGYTPLANSLASANIYVGSAGGVASAVTMSGDATLSNLGVITFANVVTAGQYARVTVDAKGRVIAGVASLDLSTATSGTLPIARGGTGAASFTANYVLLGNSTNAFQEVAPGNAGNLLTSDGTTWVSQAPSSYSDIVTIAATPYNVLTTQDRAILVFSPVTDGVINLPNITTVSNGFSVTISREVAKRVTINAFAGDTFANNMTDFEMLGQNLQSVTIMRLGFTWKIVGKSEDCTVGKACWANNQIYLGTINDKQIFTTPRGCNDSSTPTCAGGADLTKVWATDAFDISNQLANYNLDGPALSASVASFATTAAAKFCEDLDYAGYTDWYLPRPDEIAMLFQAAKSNTALVSSGVYWTSFDDSGNVANAFAVNSYQSYSLDKTNANYTRCFRRF